MKKTENMEKLNVLDLKKDIKNPNNQTIFDTIKYIS
jgi:hypothetical protein